MGRIFKEYTEVRSRHVNITYDLHSIIDGMLLSDASISLGKERKSGYIALWQHPSRVDWLKQMQSELAICGVESVMDTVIQKKAKFKDGHETSGGTYNILRTMSYVEFLSEWDRWHKDGYIII